MVLGIWINGIRAAEIAAVARAGFTLRYTQEWLTHPSRYPFSPHLPLGEESGGVEVKNFFENLLPEGSALDTAASMHNLNKHDAFGLLTKVGREVAGALCIVPDGEPLEAKLDLRPLPLEELSKRIGERPYMPFSAWDDSMRMSIAGHQDKLAVFIDQTGSMFLPNGGASTTHIIKPENVNEKLPFMPANEHFCMRLAHAFNLAVPQVELLHIPQALYVVTRFDREMKSRDESGRVSRLHQIDLCQVLNLPVSMKYQQANEYSPEGATYTDLFNATNNTPVPVQSKRDIVCWAVFNYMIGNTDAHAKNISFFLNHEGLKLAPFYDLVSGTVYGLTNLALFVGKEEQISLVSAVDWVEFCHNGDLHPSLIASELHSQAQHWEKVAPRALANPVYQPNERKFLACLATDIQSRVELMKQQAFDLSKRAR